MHAIVRAKPDTAFAIDQLRSIVRTQIVGFRITGRSLIKRIDSPVPCRHAQQDLPWHLLDYPDTVGSVDNLGRLSPEYWIGRGEIAGIASGFVEKLLTFRARHHPSIGVHSKA